MQTTTVAGPAPATSVRLQWWVIGPRPLEFGAHRSMFLARAWAGADDVRYVYPANVLFLIRSMLRKVGFERPGDWGRWELEKPTLHHTSRVGQDVPPILRLDVLPRRWWLNRWPVGCWLLPAGSWLSEWRFGRWLRREMARHKVEGVRQVLVNYVWELSSSLFAPSAELVVYDCADHYRTYPGEIPERIDWNERRAAQRSHLVVVSSLSFAPRLREMNSNVAHVPNGVSQALLEEAAQSGASDPGHKPAKPVVVYHGLTHPWRFDRDLLCAVARLCPDYEFRVYAPRHEMRSPSTIPPNVRLLGWLPHEELGAMLRECALGFMPYILQEPTLSGFPLKMFEYLAAGLPVVSTRLREVERFADYVRLCDHDPVQTAALIRQEIEQDSSDRRQIRRALASQYTWQALGDQYRALVVDAMTSRSDRRDMNRIAVSAR